MVGVIAVVPTKSILFEDNIWHDLNFGIGQKWQVLPRVILLVSVHKVCKNLIRHPDHVLDESMVGRIVLKIAGAVFSLKYNQINPDFQRVVTYIGQIWVGLSAKGFGNQKDECPDKWA